MRIAFYLENIKDNLDYNYIPSSNPGIGGTHFLIWLLSAYLAKNSTNEIYLFSPSAKCFIPELNAIQVDSITECLTKCKERDIDYLILRGPFIKKEIIESIERHKQKVILWSHNLENYIAEKNIAHCEYIIKNICVSNEQLMRLSDTDLAMKSTYIYNGIDFTDYDYVNNLEIEKIPNRICYMGNLYPHSGIESMAYAWMQLERLNPNLELYIIGGNDLYNINSFKKSYSTRTRNQTEKIIKKAFYNNNELKKNVHFTGVIGGIEKLKLMKSASVGIANITDAGETFGLGVVEFQALGIPVVSIDKLALKETVYDNQTGYLVKNKKYLHKAIMDILLNSNISDDMGANGITFVKQRFNISDISKQWDELFLLLNSNEECIKASNAKSKSPILSFNAKLRSIVKFIPSHLFYIYLNYGLKRLLEKANII